jgi:hypothetical protein
MASGRGTWKRWVQDHARENLQPYAAKSFGFPFQAPRLPSEDTWRDMRDLDYCFQNPYEDEGEKLNLMLLLMIMRPWR